MESEIKQICDGVKSFIFFSWFLALPILTSQSSFLINLSAYQKSWLVSLYLKTDWCLCHPLLPIKSTEAKSKEKNGVWNLRPMTMTSAYDQLGSRIHTFTMGGNPLPESTLTLCQSKLCSQSWASTLTSRSARRRRPNFRHTIESTKLS
jgi:hypothetical protein